MKKLAESTAQIRRLRSVNSLPEPLRVVKVWRYSLPDKIDFYFEGGLGPETEILRSVYHHSQTERGSLIKEEHYY